MQANEVLPIERQQRPLLTTGKRQDSIIEHWPPGFACLVDGQYIVP